MARIYLASSWLNEEQGHYVHLLREAGHDVYDFKNPTHAESGFQWTAVDPEWKNWTADQYRDRLLSSPTAAFGYMNDLRAMEWADTCVLLLPCGRSAHLEGGWFAGRGKRLIIVTRDGEEPELMALMANEIVISEVELLIALEGEMIVSQAKIDREVKKGFGMVEENWTADDVPF